MGKKKKSKNKKKKANQQFLSTIKFNREELLLDASEFKRRSLTTSRVTQEATPIAISATKQRHSIDQVFTRKVGPYARLPKTHVPVFYHIDIFPQLSLFTFQGRVIIGMEVQKKSNNIVLNSVGLEIESIHFYDNFDTALADKDSPNRPPESLEFIVTDETETLVVKLANNSKLSTTCALKIYFRGVITDELKGLHYSRYVVNNKETYTFLTKCEPCDARRVFPCFDEPHFKAKFTLSLTIPKRKMAIANMQEKNVRSNPRGPYKSVRFEESINMSTNVFCFVIGEFEYKQVVYNGTRIRAYAHPSRKGQAKFALSIARKSINFMNNFTSQHYMLPKLDLVAVGDMSTEIQSNWGIIVCREDSMLIRDTKISLKTPRFVFQRIAFAISHAVALQWFGNLVSVFWWSDIWLNVGLATFFKYLILEDTVGSFQSMSQFPNEVKENAMRVDMFSSAYPLVTNLDTPREIEETFNEISYDKGATLLRMAQDYVGADEFKEHISSYLTSYYLGSVITLNLWTVMEFPDAYGKSMKDIMNPWTQFNGYPLITLVNVKDKNVMARLTLKQERFQPDVDNPIPDSTIWTVPYNIISSSDPSTICHRGVLDVTESVIQPQASIADFFLLNAGLVGYFRVRYPSSVMPYIFIGIQSKQIKPLDRLGILHDLFAMAISGYNSVVDVLQLLPAYVSDEDYNIWKAIDDIIQELDHYISYSDVKVYEKFCEFILDLYKEIEKKRGREAFEKKNPPIHEFTRFFKSLFQCFALSRNITRQEDHIEYLFFALVIRRLCLLGHPETVSWAKDWFIRAENDESDLHPDLVGAISFGFIKWKSNEVNLHLIFRAYRKADSLDAKELVIPGFALFTSKILIRKILQFAISNHVSKVHTVLIMTTCAMTKLGRHMAWYFFKEHQPHFSREYYHNEQLLKPFFRHVLTYFMTIKRYNDVKKFFSEHPFQGLTITVEQTLYSISRNISWAKRDLIQVNKFLTDWNVQFSDRQLKPQGKNANDQLNSIATGGTGIGSASKTAA